MGGGRYGADEYETSLRKKALLSIIEQVIKDKVFYKHEIEKCTMKDRKGLKRAYSLEEIREEDMVSMDSEDSLEEMKENPEVGAIKGRTRRFSYPTSPKIAGQL